jgi:hypothetical protein
LRITEYPDTNIMRIWHLFHVAYYFVRVHVPCGSWYYSNWWVYVGQLLIRNSLQVWGFHIFNFSEKMTWFAIYLVLWTEFSTSQCTNLKRRWLDLFCNYHYIQCVCNHSTVLVVICFLVVIFHFATILAHQKFYR